MMDELGARALELADLAVLECSKHGTVTAWSRAAERLYGYSETEVLGRSAELLCFPGERSALASAAGGSVRGAEVERHRRRDGSEVYVDLRFADAGDGVLVCARDVTSERRARTGLAASRDALGVSRAELHRLAGRILDAQESERRRIARELHDDFKQRLGALGFQLAALAERAAPATDRIVADRLGELVDQVVKLGDDVRRISHRLHPAALERLGLAAALEAHAAGVESRRGLVVRLVLRDAEEALPEDVALGLYRIAQEALENVVRHSGAKRAHLSLVRDRREVRLAVADDGAGFDPEEARARGGLGLASIEERVRLLGGRLRLASAPEAGTELEVVVPLGTDERETEDAAGAADAAADDVAGRPRLVGPYRLLEVLGEGSTATVYLAEEPPPLARRVAIKLYRVPLVGRRETYSFKAERQALARLRHPNVGQIHEARTTEDGDPYIVMEHVPGMPITEYCDRYRLDLDRRIELFAAVCDGVLHVHQKGVLHRDLKPANVLVMEQDGRAVPKIVDFGIAKGLEQPLAEGTVWTRDSAGTPAYVSPEVLAGGEADTRGDVYALGVILYQLLTGVLPAASEAEILGQLAGESLPPPSRRLAAVGEEEAEVVADARRTGARALARALRGDLDWIAIKAVAPEPESRYAGPGALARDLRRHLRAEPVLAGPPSLSYRLARFARRHRAAVVAAVLGLLVLVGGLAATAWQARRATREAMESERARAESEQVTSFLEGLFAISGPEEARGETITAREILDRGVERLESELADQPRVRARLGRTVADIYRELGFFDRARPLAEDALALHRAHFGEEHAETAKTLRTLAAVISEGGRPGSARPLLERALAIQERALGEDHPEIAETLMVLGRALYRQGERQASALLYRRAYEIVSRSLPPEHPRTIQARRSLGVAIKDLGDPEQTLGHYLRALALAEEHLGPDHPERLMLLNNLATTYSLRSDYPRARATYERLLERSSKIYGPDHWRTLRSRMSLARIHLLLGESARGRELAADTFERMERALGPDHWLTAKGALRLGNFAFLHGDYDQAETAYRRALAMASALDPDAASVAGPLSALASVAVARSDLDRAETLATSVLERLAAGLPPDGTAVLHSRLVLARAALARGDLERAEARAREILSVVDPVPPEAPTSRMVVEERARAHLVLGRAALARGDAEGARRSFELVVELMTPLFPNPSAQAYAAIALLRLDRVDEARPIAAEALGRYRDPELIELAKRHGVEIPPLQ